jgi:hypothetical protein
MKRLTQFAVGVFGMLFCLPFLFSSNMADLVGAGFPFVGGATLVVGGLSTLSNLTQKNNKSNRYQTKNTSFPIPETTQQQN